MKVTWLKWPLHIKVPSIINNFGRGSIFSGLRWSTLCTRDCQFPCRRELWVSPHSCGAMRQAPRALPVQERWSWFLSPIKRVEAVAALSKVTDNNPPPHCTTTTSPLCLLQCWSESPDFRSRDLAVTASDDRGSGEIAPRTPEEARVSGGRGAFLQSPPHKENSPETVPLFRGENKKTQTNRKKKNHHQIKGYFRIFSTFVNFWTSFIYLFFWRHFTANFEDGLLR